MLPPSLSLTRRTLNLEWFKVYGAFTRNREPDPEELEAAMASGEPPPWDIREKVEAYLDPDRDRRPGNRPKWDADAMMSRFHLDLRCELVDRIREDSDIWDALNNGKRVSRQNAFRWVECIPEQKLAALTRSSNLVSELRGYNVIASANSGKTTERHFDTVHNPSRAVLKIIWVEIEKRLESGMDIREAAESLSMTGLYPDRGRSNRERLPPGLIRGHYEKAKLLYKKGIIP